LAETEVAKTTVIPSRVKDKSPIFTGYEIFVSGKILVFHRCLFNKTLFVPFADANAPGAGEKGGKACIPSPKKKRSKKVDRDRDNLSRTLVEAVSRAISSALGSSQQQVCLREGKFKPFVISV